MANNSKLEIHPKPKQSIQINRPLIITITIVVLTVLMLAIISAFNVSKITPTTAPTKIATDKPLVVSPELNDLPENYSDVNAIKRYLPESSNRELQSLIQEFNELKNAYISLQQELAAKDRIRPGKAAEDPRTQQAKISSLEFSGLGSAIDNMVGNTDKSRPFSSLTNNQSTTNLVATPEQEVFFKDQEENNQKLAIMKAKLNVEEIYNLQPVVRPPKFSTSANKLLVQAGTLIPASLITGINTTVAGTIVAQVRQSIYDTITGKYLVIPRGSKLLGEYETRVSSGQQRVLIALTRIIRPDGSSIVLNKFSGADLLGHSGVEGNVDNHWGRILGAASISTILSFGAGAASGIGQNNNNSNNFLNTRQGGLLGAAQGISQSGQNITNRALDIAPTITLPSGYNFNVVVKKDIPIDKYTERA